MVDATPRAPRRATLNLNPQHDKSRFVLRRGMRWRMYASTTHRRHFPLVANPVPI